MARFSPAGSRVPILSVPLNAMCSNMCASPVIPGTSCAEPTSAMVQNENTGATGRSTRMKVQPWPATWTVVRAAKARRSCAAAAAGARMPAAARVRAAAGNTAARALREEPTQAAIVARAMGIRRLVLKKLATFVELVSRGQWTAAKVRASFESFESCWLRGLVRLVPCHKASQLFTQQCRNRTVAAGSQHPRLMNQIVVEGQCDVARAGFSF